VISDWCEYAPLYFFLNTWLGGRWDSRVLGGRGRTAITYIHVRDLVKMILAIVRRSRSLPDYCVYVASPDGTVSHEQLYDLANGFFYGRVPRPIFLPKLLALPGILVRQILGAIAHRPPFERVWMLRYMDRQLVVDASRTREALDWTPVERDHVLRRVLFMVENMTSQPAEWSQRNLAAMTRVAQRANLLIYEELSAVKERLMRKLTARLIAQERAQRLVYLKSLPPQEQRQYLQVILSLLLASIRSVNRSMLLGYLDEIVPSLYAGGARPDELVEVLDAFDAVLRDTAATLPRLRDHQQELHSFITLTLQLARDQVEVAHEEFLLRPAPSVRPRPASPTRKPEPPMGARVVDELSAYFQLTPSHELSMEDLKQLLAYMESKQKR